MKIIVLILTTLAFIYTSCGNKKEKVVRIPNIQMQKPEKLRLYKDSQTINIPENILDEILTPTEAKKIDEIKVKEDNEIFSYNKTFNEREGFWKKMEKVAQSLGFEPYWLYRVMIAESGINSAIQNRDTQATGLIQFMPSTARMLGTTTDQLCMMTPQEQLDYVYKFYLPYKNNITCPIDLYIVTFYPYARGKRNHYIIGSEANAYTANLIAKQNPSFDIDGNGYIELGEYRKYVRRKVFGSIPDYVFKTYQEERISHPKKDTIENKLPKKKKIKKGKIFNSTEIIQ
jgi:hypothetical protein